MKHDRRLLSAIVQAALAQLDAEPEPTLVDAHDDRARPLRRLHDLVLAGASDPFTLETTVTEAVSAFTSLLAAPGRPRARLRSSLLRARQYLLDHSADKVTLDAVAPYVSTNLRRTA